MWFGFNGSGKPENRSGLRGLCTAMLLFLRNGNDGRLQIAGKMSLNLPKYCSKILYEHTQSLLVCLFVQAVLYANKTKKKENHLRESEQLMHTEYKNPRVFFSVLEVSKGHWILWRLIPFLKIPILSDAIKLGLPSDHRYNLRAKCGIVHLSELQITGLALCFQSTGTASRLVFAQCLHLLLVFDGVGSFPAIFSKNGSEWIAVLFSLQINDCKSYLSCPSTFCGPGGSFVCRSLCSTEWALFCRNQSEGLLLPDGHANYLPPSVFLSFLGKTASQYFLQLGRMVIARRRYIWGLKSTPSPPQIRWFLFCWLLFPLSSLIFKLFCIGQRADCIWDSCVITWVQELVF